MNRAERRQFKKKHGFDMPKEPVYNIRKSDIDTMKKDAVNEAADAAMVLLLAIPIKVLRDEYGWGSKKRLPEFAEKLADEYSNFSNGDVSLEEYANLVYEYTGIKFEKNKED